MNSEDLKVPLSEAIRSGNIAPGAGVEVVFNEGHGIEGRKAGVVYVLDSSLAHHYVEVIHRARYVERAAKVETAETEPASVEDRAMKHPPRGRKT